MLYINGNYMKMEFDVIVACCGYIARIYLGINNLGVIGRDLNGEPLFWKPGSDCDNFYKNRNFPKAKQSQPSHGANQARVGPLPLNPITAHFCDDLMPPDYRGLM